MTSLHEWAVRWNIPWAAVVDLQNQMGMDGTLAAPPAPDGATEDYAMVQVRLEAPQKGCRVWRNNVGALADAEGRFVRYGLANDSKAINEKIKSGDLIGIRPVLIEQRHVGTVIGQFLSREVKKPGWQYSGKEREPAQLKWIHLVTQLGGDAAFCTGAGSL